MDCQTVIDLYNTICVGMSRATELTKSRKSKIQCRIKEHPDKLWWELMFRKANASDFLNGKVTNQIHTKWKCNLDWIVSNDTNAVKIMEGHYDNMIEVKLQKQIQIPKDVTPVLTKEDLEATKEGVKEIGRLLKGSPIMRGVK